MDVDEEQLIARLRQLSLVELDALCAGAVGARRAALVRAHAGELHRSLTDARARIAALRASMAGPDPLALLDAPSASRIGEAGQGAAERAARRLAARAAAARQVARLEEAAARLVPSLVLAERGL
jgi:hypothetical protein